MDGILHILHHAGEAPVYGVALIAELRGHGDELSPGTLYPVLPVFLTQAPGDVEAASERPPLTSVHDYIIL